MLKDLSACCDMKFLEAFPLLRIITGSDLGEEAERGRMAARLRMIGQDGLPWDPVVGRPWVVEGARNLDGKSDTVAASDYFLLAHMTARFLGAMSLRYQLTGDDVWYREGKGIVDGFIQRLVVRRDDYAFVPVWVHTPGKPVDQNAPVPQGYDSMQSTWIIQGLTQFFRVTGYEPAIDLAGKFVRALRYHTDFYGLSGEFTSDFRHFHAHTLGLLAMIDYALEVGDRELLEFADSGYHHARRLGHALIGYFPEIYNAGLHTCETCEVAEMVALAVKLSLAGTGDYWDDAERWLRNHFAELQLTDPAWIYDHIAGLKPMPPMHPWTTTERVIERNIGAFAGQATPNEWNVDIMHCCTGNATRTIYYGWESILQVQDDSLRVNMLLNRTSPWADVHSSLPYEGRVDVVVKRDCELSVRIPVWAHPQQVSHGPAVAGLPHLHQVACSVSGEARDLVFEGRYAQVGRVRRGEVVRLSFPIWETSMTTVIAATRYRIIVRGNTVVAVDPPGTIGPLYERARLRNDRAPMKKVERFVADRTIRW
jgi:hypothetical protein